MKYNPCFISSCLPECRIESMFAGYAEINAIASKFEFEILICDVLNS